MQVVAFGASHQTASVEIREKLSFSERQLSAAVSRLLAQPGVLECVILSTCNRTEFYVVIQETRGLRDQLTRFWLDEKSLPERYVDDYTYYHENEDAIRHLHRVTAGLDSLIVGEGQILAQVKAALSVAQQVDAAGQYLETLFQQAIRAGKQVRTETNIGRGSISVSSAAVEVAQQHLGSLQERIVLIYGAGKMSAHTVRALFQKGAKHVYIVNRTLERAQETAARFGGEARSIEAGRMLHAVADVIICCTAAPHYLITPDNYPHVPGRSRILIDIAVPRNIDPALGDLPGIHLLDLDGLETIARSNREERAKLIIDAEVMIENNLLDYSARLASFQITPTIQSLDEHLETILSRELSDFMQRHSGFLEREPEAALERFGQLLIGKIRHPAVVNLKALAPNEQDYHAAVLARLFDLEVEDATQRYLRKRQPSLERAELSQREWQR